MPDDEKNIQALEAKKLSLINKYDYYSIAAGLLWGINYVMVKSVLNDIPENSFLVLRFSAAVALLLLYIAATGEGIRVQREDILKIVVLGVLGVGIYNIFWTAGIHLTTASNAALIVSTSPLFAQLYVQLVKKEKISLRQWSFTLMAFLGIFLMVAQSPGTTLNLASKFFLGNIIVFVSALLFASYTVFAQPLLERYTPVKLNALAMAAGLPLLIVYSLFSGPLVIRDVSGVNFLKMLYIIVFGTAAAYICWYTGIKKTGPIKVILFHYLVPVSSMILGIMFLGESVSLMQVLGALLAMGGMLAAKSG